MTDEENRSKPREKHVEMPNRPEMKPCEEYIEFEGFKKIISELKEDIMKEFFKTFEKLNNKIDELERTVKTFNEKEKVLNAKISRFETERRRKNLIIKGIPESETGVKDLEKVIMENITEKLKIKINPPDIDMALRVGKSKGIYNKPRPILLKLTTEKKRTEIFGKKLYLKGSNIYIDPNLTKEAVNEKFKSCQVHKASRTKMNARKINQPLSQSQPPTPTFSPKSNK
jgi:hypothetical protein